MDGRTFEFWAAELLRRNGFHHVRVTQESGDQGVDIVASRLGAKYAIQCKCYSGRIGNHAVQEVFAGKEIYGCKHAAVLTNQYFTKGGIEAAEKTGVYLWDRDWIINAL